MHHDSVVGTLYTNSILLLGYHIVLFISFVTTHSVILSNAPIILNYAIADFYYFAHVLYKLTIICKRLQLRFLVYMDLDICGYSFKKMQTRAAA